jgi:quercetin dioxygenase-like cupin family protein
VAELSDREILLRTGDVFCIDENELHRFKTTDSEMRVIAYHPESDFGPTDQVQPMINRTILKKTGP